MADRLMCDNTQVINSFVSGLYSISANVHSCALTFHAHGSKVVQLVVVTCTLSSPSSFLLSSPSHLPSNALPFN